MTDEPTPAQRILAWAAAEGVSMKAEFVPYSVASKRPDWTQHDGKPWKGLTWRVTIQKGGRDVLTTDYSAGVAHCPAYSLPAEGSTLRRAPYSARTAREMLIDYEIENGKAARFFMGDDISGDPKRPILPSLDAVLWSLAMDSSVLDEGGFENWAASLGYDTDSRRAEAIYRACLDTALKLRAAVGDAGLSALREAAQDY